MSGEIRKLFIGKFFISRARNKGTYVSVQKSLNRYHTCGVGAVSDATATLLHHSHHRMLDYNLCTCITFLDVNQVPPPSLPALVPVTDSV